jgi:hypothetical protein
VPKAAPKPALGISPTPLGGSGGNGFAALQVAAAAYLLTVDRCAA